MHNVIKLSKVQVFPMPAGNVHFILFSAMNSCPFYLHKHDIQFLSENFFYVPPIWYLKVMRPDTS